LFGARRRHESASEAVVDEQQTPKPEEASDDPVSAGFAAAEPGTDDAGEGSTPPTGSDGGEARSDDLTTGTEDAQAGAGKSDEPKPAAAGDGESGAESENSKNPAPEESTPDSPAPEASAPDAPAPDAKAPDVDQADQPTIPPDLPRILAIANQKGGVGKTTTSVNLGASLAEMGFRVLVVDLDPQGNATTGLGVNAREVEGSTYDVIMSDAAVEDCIEPTSLKNLFVVPATIDLAGAEIELVPAFSRELKLRRALHEIRDDYDYILIDCPPSLGLLTVNGLAAADDVLVPIQCEYYALEGLSQLIRNVTLVRTNLNPTLDVRGIVLTMYDARTKLADQVEQEVRKHFGRTVYLTVIPRTVRLSEAPSFGQPIILFDPTSRGAVAYRELAKEVSSGATRRTG
jgi:ATPases involved in chromosome partitioning